jgi:hypothetical protein
MLRAELYESKDFAVQRNEKMAALKAVEDAFKEASDAYSRTTDILDGILRAAANNSAATPGSASAVHPEVSSKRKAELDEVNAKLFELIKSEQLNYLVEVYRANEAMLPVDKRPDDALIKEAETKFAELLKRYPDVEPPKRETVATMAEKEKAKQAAAAEAEAARPAAAKAAAAVKAAQDAADAAQLVKVEGDAAARAGELTGARMGAVAGRVAGEAAGTIAGKEAGEMLATAQHVRAGKAV